MAHSAIRVVFIGSIFFLSATFTHAGVNPRGLKNDPTSVTPRELRSGDLVFRTGRGRWSPVFARLNPLTGFSHVGVILNVGENRWVVAHAEADDFGNGGGIKISTLRGFLNDADRFEIRRSILPHATKEQFARMAWSAWEKSAPFDSEFRLDDNGDRVYCSEFIWRLSLSLGTQPLGRVETIFGRSVITVDSIYQRTVAF